MKYGFILTGFCLVFMTISQPAYAYLDAGTGSMIIQGLLASIAMAAMVIKMYWQKLISIFSSLIQKTKPVSKDQDKL